MIAMLCYLTTSSSHHPQEVLLAQSSLYVHKGGLKPDLFHFIYLTTSGLDCYNNYVTIFIKILENYTFFHTYFFVYLFPFIVVLLASIQCETNVKYLSYIFTVGYTMS